MPCTPRRRAATRAALLSLVLACGGPESHDASGVVREVLPEDRQVVIEHGDIPGFMDAMTMSFDVADPALLEQLAPGQEIDFRIERTPRSIRVVEISVRAQGDGSAPVLLPRPAERTPAPAFSLIDQAGAPLALADLRGRAVLLDFVFTNCPGPCPILTSTHVALQQMLPADVRERTRFVSISLDPLRDTPEALRSYAEARGADLADWSFLTGPVDEVDAVVASYGVGSVRRPDGDIDHTVATFLIDPEGRIAGRYLGLEIDPRRLLNDIRGVL